MYRILLNIYTAYLSKYTVLSINTIFTIYTVLFSIPLSSFLCHENVVELTLFTFKIIMSKSCYYVLWVLYTGESFVI